MHLIREKKHRFDLSLYKGEVTVSFTINVKNHLYVLNNKFIFKEFEKILLDEIGYFEENEKSVASPFTGEQNKITSTILNGAEKPSLPLNEIKKGNNKCCSYEIPVYLFMPDHIHLILQGNNESSDVINIVNMFKQRTGYWFYQNMKNVKWQKDYYDHIIKNEQDLVNHVNYILYNPVRKEIVTDRREYKYKGSTLYNFDDWDY